MKILQTTLKNKFNLIGTGLHTGRPVRMSVSPAAADTGVVFVRSDISDRSNRISASFRAVTDTKLCTRISNADGVSVSTVEHLMAALAGCGVHNAIVELDAPEIPIMDGSSRKFVKAILSAGVETLGETVKVLRVLKPVSVSIADAFAEIAPSDDFEIEFAISFTDAAIGSQHRSLNMKNGSFVRELADCRTFCRQSDVEFMRKNGLALGGSMDNAIVVDGARVLNEEGFRHTDECVRHKMLDALGDLALAGMPIFGAYRGIRAGHHVTNQLLRKLFADPSAFEIVEADPQYAEKLPGVGVTFADLDLAI